MDWSLLPPPTEEIVAITAGLKGRFQGDPSYEYENVEKKEEGERPYEEEAVVSILGHPLMFPANLSTRLFRICTCVFCKKNTHLLFLCQFIFLHCICMAPHYIGIPLVFSVDFPARYLPDLCPIDDLLWITSVHSLYLVCYS